MPHSSKASNSSLTNCGRPAPACRLGLLDEGGGVLQHQALQRGLLGAVALAVERAAIRRPDRLMGLPADGLHAGLARC